MFRSALHWCLVIVTAYILPVLSADDCSLSCKVINGNYTVGNGEEGPPRIKYPRTRRDVGFNTWVDITCQLCHSNPPSTLTWFFNERRLDINQGHRKLTYLACEQRLSVKFSDEKDEGNYTCMARNKLGQANATTEVKGYDCSLSCKVINGNYTVGNGEEGPPRIKYPRTRRDVEFNTWVDITCQLCHSNPPSTLTWFFNERRLDINQGHRKLTYLACEQRLSVKFSDEKDEGNYTCMARNKLGQANATTEVKGYDCSLSCKVINGNYTVGNGEEGPPRIKYPRTRRDVDLNTWVDITCQLCHSNPPSTLTWFFNEKRLDINQGHRKLTYLACEQRLSVKFSDEKDEGNYTCMARNKLGQANATTEVKGYGQFVPLTGTSLATNIKIEGKNGSVNGHDVMIGSTISITCTTLFHTKCRELLWRKDSEPLSYNERIKGKIGRIITQKNVTRCTSTITIRNVMTDDKGKYECFNIRSMVSPVEMDRLKTITIDTVTCFIGYYCPPKSNTAKPCPTGRFSMYKNATSVDQCQRCPTYTRNEVLVDLKAKVSKTTVEDFRTACPEFADADSQKSSGLSRGGQIAIGVSLSVVAIITVLAVFCGFRSWRGYKKLIGGPHKDIDQIETPVVPRSNHVFVCYSSKNREWVHDTLLANLRAQDFRTFIDFADFEVGLPIHENIINGIYGSWTTVFVLSKDSLKSFYARTELSQALVASRTTGHQVIVILYEKCKLPAEITKKVYLDWTDEEHRNQFWQKLYRAIKKPLENETAV